MTNLKPSKDQLKHRLDLAIRDVYSPGRGGSGETVRTSLSALYEAGYLDPVEWAACLHGIHKNSEIEERDRELLYTAFAAFTEEKVGLRHLSHIITLSNDGNEDFRAEELDRQDLFGDSFLRFGSDGESQELDKASEPERTWQERVGSKILDIAPNLITPPPLPIESEGYNIKSSKAILKIAVINNADWVIPPNLSRLEVEHQRRVTAFLKSQIGTETLLKSAIDLGHLRIVKKLIQLLKKVDIDQSDHSDLLHTAIRDKRPDIAKFLIDEYPKMIGQRPNGKSALQLLESLERFPRRKDFRDFLISKTLRLKPPSLVRELLLEQTGTKTQLYVDLTVFNDRSSHSFDSFLESLKDINKPKYLVPFFSTLMYVEMPRMRDTPGNTSREEAFVVLNWLRTKLVRSILELHVPDSLSNPHPDEGIQKWLSEPESANGFKEIAMLNWEKLDLSLETLKMIPGLRKVYLYSDNLNTLKFWTGSEGICCQDYQHITEVIIVIVQNKISEKRATFLQKETEKRLSGRVAERAWWACEEHREPPPFAYEVIISKCNVEENESLGLDNPPSSVVTPKQIIEIDQFFRQDPRAEYRENNPSAKSTRVAIIDNGVDAGINTIWNHVTACRSFVELSDTRESSCWLASDSHGTQMASIVIDIDQHCLLYIAKVGTDRRSKPKPDDVAEAIKWAAATENVDIIIISMTFNKEDPAIHNAIIKAYENGSGPVIFCATEDVGNSGKEVFPAYWDQTIAISACNRAGKSAKYTDDKAQYWFQGYEIYADCLSYSPCGSEAPKGSSVATAIADGVASLILSLRYQADPGGKSRKSRRQTIEGVFNDMKEEENKYVFPRRFFKAGYEENAPWSTERWGEWIQDMFRAGNQYV